MSLSFSTKESDEVSTILDIKRSYIDPNLFLDDLNRRVYPIKNLPKIVTDNMLKQCKVFSSPIDQNNLVEFLSNNALNSPIVRIKYHDTNKNLELKLYKLPNLTDFQMDYIDDLFNLLNIKLTNQDFDESPSFSSIDFFFKYHVITEFGMEIHNNEVYFTFMIYNPEPTQIFKELKIKEYVVVDDEINSEDEEQIEMDENDNQVLEFDLKLELIEN